MFYWNKFFLLKALFIHSRYESVVVGRFTA